MRNMFSECTSLILIDFSSFDTTLVTDMEGMFQDDSSLISLDLSNFNTISLTNMRYIFKGCKSLVYINLISFIEYNYNSVDSILSNDLDKIILCYDEQKADRIHKSIKNINTNNNCNNTCFSESKKIIVEKKICIDDCNKDKTYIYEYNNMCYDYEITQTEVKNIDISENNDNIKNSEEIKITEKNEDSVKTTNSEKNENKDKENGNY